MFSMSVLKIQTLVLFNNHSVHFKIYGQLLKKDENSKLKNNFII